MKRANASDSGHLALLLFGLLWAVHLTLVISIIVQTRPLIWPLHNDTIHRAGPAADFYAVYNAALNYQRGVDPYSGYPDGVTPYKFPFRYLPIVAVCAQPLTQLAPRRAWIAWVICLEGLLALLIWALWKSLPQGGIRVTAIGALLLSSPYFLELYMGQFTFAAVTACSLGLWLPPGPLLYCSSTLIKPFTLVALPALARHRRYWWHLALALLGVLVLSLPYFMNHPDQWAVFYGANFNPQGGMDAGNYGLVRILSLAANDLQIPVVSEHWASWIRLLRWVVLAVTALLVICSRSHSVITGVSALLLAHFLTYPHVWEHHMSGVCVVGAMLLTVPNRNRTSTGVVVFSLCLLALPTPFVFFDVGKDPTVWDPSGQWPEFVSYLLALSKALPCVLLYLHAVVGLWKAGLLPPRAVLRSALVRAS